MSQNAHAHGDARYSPPAPALSEFGAEQKDDVCTLAHKLRAMTRADGSIDAAEVRLIGLDEIREAAGARWPRIAEKVRQGSLAILRHNGRADDVIIPAGDGFLVMLSPGSPGANQARCQIMREALVKFYLGDEALQALRAEVNARSLSADGFADLLAARPLAEKAPLTDLIALCICSASEGLPLAEVVGPRLGAPTGARVGYNPDFILDGRHTGASYLSADLSVLEWAARALEKDEHPVLGLSVHATTLQRRRSREAYLAALNTSFQSIHRPAFITIAEIEKRTPLMSITEWCGALRAHTPKVALDFHYSDMAIASIGVCGAWAAGFHLPMNQRAQTGPRRTFMLDQIAFWSRRVHAQGLKLAIAGIHDPTFLADAAARGADLATGPCVGRRDIVCA